MSDSHNYLDKSSFEITLKQCGVEARLEREHVGPSLHHAYVKLTAGTPVDKVLKRAKDLSFYLKLPSLTITAEPATSLLKFSFARAERAFPSLEEITIPDSPEMSLPFVAGINMMGEPVLRDLAQTPHMLIAGTTGSGKSVYLHNIICSLLRSRTKDQMQLVIVDPKSGAEFGVYSRVPHMFGYNGVVSDRFLLADLLQKIIQVSDRRYSQFTRYGVHNLAEYNRKVPNNQQEPFIVIVIDELADLFGGYRRAMEPLVQSLVQKSRAAGVHLILATQRPTVKVLTGDIKANCPTRVALRVQTAVDSRVILDAPGAEKLLDKGDLLYSNGGVTERLQSPLVTREYTDAIIKGVRHHDY